MSCNLKELSPFIREEYPFNSNYCIHKGINGKKYKQHYLDEGEGPVVILLHGNPTWSFYYRNLILKLRSNGFRCIVPDHIGCGLSDKPKSYEYSLKRRINDIEYLIDHLGIKHYNLVVHDWGGAIGLGVATRNPQSVKSIVILNSAAFRSKFIPLSIAFLKVPILGKFLIEKLNIFALIASNRAAEIPLSPTVREGYLWPYKSPKHRIAIWNFVKDIPMLKRHKSYSTLFNVEANLKCLSHKRIGIFWGEKDFCFNKYFLHKWIAFFPNAKIYKYSSAGHYVLEDAKKTIFEDINRFLEK